MEKQKQNKKQAKQQQKSRQNPSLVTETSGIWATSIIKREFFSVL